MLWHALFECLFYVRETDFSSLFKVRHVMGALIMTSIDSVEKSRLLRVSNQEPLDHELSSLTIRPRHLTTCFMCGDSMVKSRIAKKGHFYNNLF